MHAEETALDSSYKLIIVKREKNERKKKSGKAHTKLPALTKACDTRQNGKYKQTKAMTPMDRAQAYKSTDQ